MKLSLPVFACVIAMAVAQFSTITTSARADGVKTFQGPKKVATREDGSTGDTTSIRVLPSTTAVPYSSQVRHRGWTSETCSGNGKCPRKLPDGATAVIACLSIVALCMLVVYLLLERKMCSCCYQTKEIV
ncbi:uncharacterized protein LY89DRAFT_355734 [Mollisia scopiformis]|uniref:Uncharacterized protein n=1 Tax=Mollisia scopiformis TaxID=149040 RepID=A0A132B5A4_MOLSC|nr:uncharacterized protein LY89DRAFT_355734 [Mollisia scopiformis]KUJ07521.1 hypothetical protein LY89DRAFT_355734 [Mollisia scopiformis]